MGRAADLAKQAIHSNMAGELEAAAGAYLALERLTVMPPRTLLDMAYVLGSLGELNASSARCCRLLHVPV